MDDHELAKLANDVRRAFDVLRQWSALTSVCGAVAPLLDDVDRQSGRLTAPGIVICLCGATGAGKSALLNALARRSIAEEGVDRPTTRDINLYAAVGTDIDSLRLPADRVRCTFETDCEALGDKILIDAPDMNSTCDENRELLKHVVDVSDVVLVVAHHQSIVERAPLDFLSPYAHRKHMAFILNRIDELADKDRSALISQWQDS